MPDGLVRPPAHLSRASKAFWREVAVDYELEKGDYRLLRAALESWDRCEEARQALAEHGCVYLDRFGQPRPRPEVAIERDARAQYVRTIRELALDGGAIPQPARRRGG